MLPFTKEELQSFIAASFETCVSIASAMTFTIRILADINSLIRHKDEQVPQGAIYLIAALSILLSFFDGYVHYRIYSHERYNDKKIEATPLINPNTNSETRQPKITFSIKLMALLCAWSCSIDIAGVPIVIMALMRGSGTIGPVTKAQRRLELGLSAISTIFAAVSFPRIYNKGKEHLTTGGHSHGHSHL